MVEDWQATSYVNPKKVDNFDITDLNFVITLLGDYHSAKGEPAVTKSAFRFGDAIKFMHYLGTALREDILKLKEKMDSELDEYGKEAERKTFAYLDAHIEMAESFLQLADGLHRLRTPDGS